MQSLFDGCRYEFRQLKGRILEFKNEGLTLAHDSLADEVRQWHFLLDFFPFCDVIRLIDYTFQRASHSRYVPSSMAAFRQSILKVYHYHRNWRGIPVS